MERHRGPPVPRSTLWRLPTLPPSSPGKNHSLLGLTKDTPNTFVPPTPNTWQLLPVFQSQGMNFFSLFFFGLSTGSFPYCRFDPLSSKPALLRGRSLVSFPFSNCFRKTQYPSTPHVYVFGFFPPCALSFSFWKHPFGPVSVTLLFFPSASFGVSPPLARRKLPAPETVSVLSSPQVPFFFFPPRTDPFLTESSPQTCTLPEDLFSLKLPCSPPRPLPLRPSRCGMQIFQW